MVAQVEAVRMFSGGTSVVKEGENSDGNASIFSFIMYSEEISSFASIQ